MSKASAIRKNILELSHNAKSAHVGSSLSCVEILDVVFDLSQKPGEFKECSIILSKGHAAMALYATAIEYGLLSAEIKNTYLKDGTQLWGHPSKSEKYPFINWSTGSLGHGLPSACGIAYARKYAKKDSKLIVTILSDGELNEGSNWEAFLFAAHHKLNNIIVIIDYNKIQSFGRCDEVLGLEPLQDKFKAFNWDVFDLDGHNEEAIHKAITTKSDKPKVIIAHTVKGKGITEYENTIESHYKPINPDLYKKYVENKG